MSTQPLGPIPARLTRLPSANNWTCSRARPQMRMTILLFPDLGLEPERVDEAYDVVFTSTYAGTVYAFDTQTGKTLWTTKAPAGINSFPAIDGDTLLVGAGTTGFDKNPHFQLIAYSIS
jgi:hypothetical protein